jgi:hypothetical protein
VTTFQQELTGSFSEKILTAMKNKRLLTIAAILSLFSESQAQSPFTKITNGPIATDKGNFGGATWSDFSNRGLLDLLVCDFAGGKNVFYQNNGGGAFTKITNAPFVQNAAFSVGPAAADFDNDGYLDLLISAGDESDKFDRFLRSLRRG